VVSIIIPTYNYEAFITATLDSVKNQTFTNWECLIIDDGSTDNTRQKVMEFVADDKRFKYFYQKNGGVSKARNYGIQQAQGEYIQFLDGDDLLQPNKILLQINEFNRMVKADIVYSDFRYFDDGNNNRLRHSLFDEKPNNWLPQFSGSGKAIVDYLSKSNFLIISAPIIKKKSLKKIGGFNEAMKGLEDRDFWMRCATSNLFFHYVTDNNSFALVRVHPTSASRSTETITNGYFQFLVNCLHNPYFNFIQKTMFMLKYVEVFWDCLFKRIKFQYFSTPMFMLSLLLFPIYPFIFLIRFTSKKK
jgi:glycosyltransferase involved in cell wall biosynthesis